MSSKKTKKHDLEVLPVKGNPDRPRYREVHENLLKPPFRLAVVGSSKSGKCLSGDGVVITKNGPKKLKEVSVGDYIDTKEGFSKVLDVINNGMKKVVDLFIGEKKMTATEEHKIDTLEGKIRVKDLNSHTIITKNGNRKFICSSNPREMTTYDLEVNNKSHTFYYNDISVSNSNYVVNLLRPCYYGGGKIGGKKVESCFDKIYIFSPNIGMDDTTRCFRKLCQEQDIKQDYKDSYIDNIIAYQKTRAPNEDKVLIIADDLPGLGAKYESRIFTSSSYLRHLNVSIIYISQIYQGKNGGLPKIVANNIDALAMFRMPSERQIKDFCEDMAGTFNSKRNVQNLLEYCTREPFQFAFFNYRDLNVWKNHTEHLWDKYTPDGKFAPDFDEGRHLAESDSDSDDSDEESDSD